MAKIRPKVTRAYSARPETLKLIDLITPLKTEYDNLIKIDL